MNRVVVARAWLVGVAEARPPPPTAAVLPAGPRLQTHLYLDRLHLASTAGGGWAVPGERLDGYVFRSLRRRHRRPVGLQTCSSAKMWSGRRRQRLVAQRDTTVPCLADARTSNKGSPPRAGGWACIRPLSPYSTVVSRSVTSTPTRPGGRGGALQQRGWTHRRRTGSRVGRNVSVEGPSIST